ncbi:MAG: hypothetical protein HXS54_09380 [Theionarchaea archaeon]|nr:hypothetical protein [Theionarchaea archaeon]
MTYKVFSELAEEDDDMSARRRPDIFGVKYVLNEERLGESSTRIKGWDNWNNHSRTGWAIWTL